MEIDKKRDITTTLVYGSPGVGKTKTVLEWADKLKIQYYLKDDTDLWDGYNNQEMLLLDNFNGRMKYNLLLQILSEYPLQLPIKCGYRISNWKYVMITSQLDPNEMYKNILIDNTQYQTRLHNIYHFLDDGQMIILKEVKPIIFD